MTIDKKIIEKIWVNVCRFILAITFILSGFVKAIDPIGGSYKLHEYFSLFHFSILSSSTTTISFAVFLSVLEFWIGSCLLFGVRRKMSTAIVFLMMLVLTPLTLYLALKNPITDCGCFGDALKLTNWQTFYKNIVLLIAALSVFLGRPKIISFISEKLHWLFSLYMIAYPLVLALYCLSNLPIIDFRPYRRGVNIAESMIVPKGEKLPVYKTEFLLEKNGVKKSFTLDNYPDSTWKFIDSKNTLVEKGYDPPIKDFLLQDPKTGDDMTQKILQDKRYVFLLIANRVEEADDDDLDLINAMYDYARENGYPFYCVTSSPEKDIRQWCDRSGAEYPFLVADDVVLKTIIRSNPGLLLLRQGTILNKWNHDNIPDETDQKFKLSKLPMGHVQTDDDLKTIAQCIGWFFIPLIILLWLDLLFIKRTLRKKRNLLLNPLINKKMRKNIVAGNWKMNMTLQEGIDLVKDLNAVLANATPNCDVIICTPFIHLASVSPIADKKIGVGAENCADKDKGAYTGEVSAAMVASTGAKYVVLGHSERRAYYHETSETLKAKVLLALANGLTPIFCVGEVLAEREAGKQNEVVFSQLNDALFALSAEEFSKIVIAYEPVWAIGTGKTATGEQAEEVHAYIRKTIADKYGKEVAEETSILYGGSCKASNAKELFAKPDIDGGLIGGASLKAADFKGIIDAFN